jgi:hypothetical protein
MRACSDSFQLTEEELNTIVVVDVELFVDVALMKTGSVDERVTGLVTVVVVRDGEASAGVVDPLLEVTIADVKLDVDIIEVIDEAIEVGSELDITTIL